MIKKSLIACIKIYQNSLGLLLPPSCRFYPSCSSYATDALQNFPLGKALWLTLRRISKCHPFHSGGYDPLPTHKD